MPTLGIAHPDPCWIQLGGGSGVLVVGIGGFGIVSLTIYGAGLLFATGQLAAGGIALGQVGVGISAFVGQAGGGLVALGQLVIGAVVAGQVPIGIRGAEFFEQLSGELVELLSWRRPMTADD